MTRMTQRAIETYAGTAAMFFNTPNRQALSVNRNLGWRVVDTPPTYYRIENLHPRAPRGFKRMVALSVDRLLDTYLDHDRPDRRDRALTVEQHHALPVASLTALYVQSVPETFHAARNEGFYQWRFANPRWQYRTYLGVRYGEIVASIVAGTRTAGDETITRLVDILPIEPTEADRGAIATLIDAVIADHADTDMFAVLSRSLPEQLLAKRGFVSDRTFPLSQFSKGLTLVCRPLSASWHIDGLPIDAADAWSFTFAERDTS